VFSIGQLPLHFYVLAFLYFLIKAVHALAANISAKHVMLQQHVQLAIALLLGFSTALDSASVQMDTSMMAQTNYVNHAPMPVKPVQHRQQTAYHVILLFAV